MKLTHVHSTNSGEEAMNAEKRRDELVSEFDKLRQQYNKEHADLRSKYQGKFDSVLQVLEELDRESTK